ncbi:MAG: NAD(P)/FAD-dependent oxidoreductase [Candidatus Peribacteria bacterium]|jgi:predicted Rossmann fold flavoprotein|nr:NAD(P)/FAD-dependent oxidoreductase [Candidatus Peribacteria bacterium]
MPIRDVIIVGAGPSGIFSALHLPSDLNILLLEKAEKPAQKLLMSAKGRGNLTNIHLSAQEYVSDDSHFVQQALSHYGPQDFLSFLNQHMIAYHKEDNGRILLASGKVAQFHDFLLSQLSDRRIEIAYRQSLLNLRKEKGIFLIETTTDHFQAKNVILATGSKSIPALGSSDIALQIAKKYALSSTDFYPALVGFETTKNLSALSGSSVIANGELYLHNKLVYQQT